MDAATALSMVGIALALGIAFVALAVLSRRGRLKPETSRKAAHVVVGLTAVSFGWLFDETLPVLILSAGGLAFAIGIRRVQLLRDSFGPVLHAVRRRSLGDYCIPIVVPLLHELAMPDRVFYVVPILVLTLADSAAALIGRNFGLWSYRTDDGSKTLEGSATVAVVTGVVVFAALLLDGYDWPRAVAVSVLMAVLVMLAEAVCWRGLDNLVLPLGSFALLKTLEIVADEMIVARVFVSVALTVFAVAWHRRAGLIGAAGAAAAFVIYACWAIGGMVWAIPPIVLLICLPFFGARHAESRDGDLGVGPILAMSAVPLAWMFLERADVLAGALLPFTASWAAVLGVVWVVRERRDRLIGARDRILILKVIAALGVIGTLCCSAPGGVGRPGVTVVVAVSAFLSAATAEFGFDAKRRFGSGEWVWAARAGIVMIGSAAAAAAAFVIEGGQHVS